MRTGMNDIQNDFKSIVFSFDKTFGYTSGFKTGWSSLSNCRVMTRLLMLYNGGICYDFSPISYRFFFLLTTGRQ